MDYQRKILKRGFTIIELMVATLVFSLVLLICLTALMSIGRSYYKGVTVAKVQNTARQLVDEISQGIQLSSQSVMASNGPAGPQVDASSDPTGIFCIGFKRYTYAIDREVNSQPSSNVNDKQIKTAILRDNLQTPCTSATTKADLNLASNSATSILGENMRISRLEIKPISSDGMLWNIAVTVVYGKTDLLEVANGRTVCKPNIGKEFCGFSEIVTNVKRRMGGN